MLYLVSEILICLIVAAALGAAVGWLARSLMLARTERSSEAEWRRRLRQSEALAGTFKNQLTEAKLTEEKLRARLQELEGDAAGAADSETISALQAELAQKNKKIEILKLQVSQSEAALTSEWESLKARKTELAERQQRLDARAKRGESEQQKLQEQLKLLKQRHDRLAAELEAAKRVLVAEREQRAEPVLEEVVPERAGPEKAAPKKAAPKKAAPKKAAPKKAAPKKAAPKKAAPKKAPPAEKDDLQEIRGIGPVLRRKLHDLGVTSFRQIASWSDDDVARVAEQLGFKPERIRRGRWIEQSKELAQSSS